MQGYEGPEKAIEIIKQSFDNYKKYIAEQEQRKPELQSPKYSTYKYYFG